VIFVISGCSPSVQERIVVQGTVTYQGNPINDGVISFIPAGGSMRESLGANIKEGRYSISSASPLMAGTYRVEIQAYRETGRQVPNITAPNRNKAGQEMQAEKVPYLPEEFNTSSRLTAEITSESNAVNFEL
jgi:hypothetical protein